VHYFSVHGRNRATEGTAYQSIALRGNSASIAIDGKKTRTFTDDSCLTSYFGTNIWWRVDFVKPIFVYGVEITPGKFDI